MQNSLTLKLAVWVQHDKPNATEYHTSPDRYKSNNISPSLLWHPFCHQRFKLDLTSYSYCSISLVFLFVFLSLSTIRGEKNLVEVGDSSLLFISGNEWKELVTSVDLLILSFGFVPHLRWGRRKGGGLNPDAHLFSGAWGMCPAPCFSALAGWPPGTETLVPHYVGAECPFLLWLRDWLKCCSICECKRSPPIAVFIWN